MKNKEMRGGMCRETEQKGTNGTDMAKHKKMRRKTTI